MSSDPREAHLSANVRSLLFFFGITLSLLVLYILRGVLAPLFVAFLLAYALDPAVDKLEQWRVPRGLGAVIVVLGLLGLIVTGLVFAIPALVQELQEAGEDLPKQLGSLERRIDPWLFATFKVHAPRSMAELAKGLSNVQFGPLAAATATAVFGTLSYVGVVLSALVVPIFTIYLLMDFDLIMKRLGELVPRRWYPPVIEVATQVHRTLGGWVRGQLTANIVLSALYAVGLRIIDIRLAVPIGILTGMLAFVPYIGFGLGLGLAVTMAILDWNGVGPLIAIGALMGGVQILDAVFITPRIVGRSVGLSALEVLITMVSAGTLFGFLGVLLAVPLGAVVKLLVHRAAKAYLASKFYLRTARR